MPTQFGIRKDAIRLDDHVANLGMRINVKQTQIAKSIFFGKELTLCCDGVLEVICRKGIYENN